MTSHCANPGCAIPLRYFSDGRLFQFEVRPARPAVSQEKDHIEGVAAFTVTSSLATRVSRKVSHFWLCGQCADAFTLAFDAFKGVVVRPRSAA
jgi:hypothetical protein